ncbi:Mss4-like protein [Aspergillus desertorum]
MSTKSLNGSCLCGKITYTIDLPSSEPTPKVLPRIPPPAHTHLSSGPFSTNIIIHPAQLRYTSGEPKIFTDMSTDSGNPLPRAFCGDCGCHFTSGPKGGDWAALKWGTLDEESRKKCGELAGEIYCKRRDGWVESLAGGKGEGVFKKEAGMGKR